jgi:hypothetical protein
VILDIRSTRGVQRRGRARQGGAARCSAGLTSTCGAEPAPRQQRVRVTVRDRGAARSVGRSAAVGAGGDRFRRSISGGLTVCPGGDAKRLELLTRGRARLQSVPRLPCIAGTVRCDLARSDSPHVRERAVETAFAVARLCRTDALEWLRLYERGSLGGVRRRGARDSDESSSP